RFYTFLPHEEIARLDECVKTNPGKREAQQTLARELVRLVHGEEALTRATQATQALFGSEIKTLPKETLLEAFAGAPKTSKPRGERGAGIPRVDLLVESGLCSSKGAARKDVQGGGIYVNNERIDDASALVHEKDLLADFAVVVRKGKKSY